MKEREIWQSSMPQETLRKKEPDMQERERKVQGSYWDPLGLTPPSDSDIFFGGIDHFCTFASMISRTSY